MAIYDIPMSMVHLLARSIALFALYVDLCLRCQLLFVSVFGCLGVCHVLVCLYVCEFV